jgi:hypothetical protein
MRYVEYAKGLISLLRHRKNGFEYFKRENGGRSTEHVFHIEYHELTMKNCLMDSRLRMRVTTLSVTEEVIFWILF